MLPFLYLLISLYPPFTCGRSNRSNAFAGFGVAKAERHSDGVDFGLRVLGIAPARLVRGYVRLGRLLKCNFFGDCPPCDVGFEQPFLGALLSRLRQLDAQSET